ALPILPEAFVVRVADVLPLPAAGHRGARRRHRRVRRRGGRLRGQARARRCAARALRDSDREDAGLPRARVPRRRGDARPARHAAPLRVEDVLMGNLELDVAHLLAGGLVLLSFVQLYQDRLTALINVFALHALVLAASVAWQAYIQNADH